MNLFIQNVIFKTVGDLLILMLIKIKYSSQKPTSNKL